MSMGRGSHFNFALMWYFTLIITETFFAYDNSVLNIKVHVLMALLMRYYQM